MLDSLKAGGILMLPIILCGVIATFIIIERCYYFYITKKKDAKLMYDLRSSLDSGNYDAAALSCAEADTPASQVVKKALDCRRWDEKDMKDAVEAEMSSVIPRFEHFLTALGTIKWYKDGSTTATSTGQTLSISAGEVTNKVSYEARLEV